VSHSGKKSRVFRVGKIMKIMYSQNSDEYSKVRLERVTDSLITFTVLDEEESLLLDIKLSDLVSIKKPTGFHSACYGVGSVFFLGGTVMALSAPSIAGYDTATNGEVAAVRVAGIAAILLGAVPFFVKPAEYNIHDDWAIRVIQP